jgi:tetratricopeptide (TPR) repeat protein
MTMNTSSSGSADYVRTVTAIGTAVGKGDLRRAYELANWAIGRGMEGRVIYNARALAFQASGRFNEAIIDFRHALRFSPNDYAIHNAIGTTLLSQDRVQEAVEAFDAAIAIKADDPVVHYRHGQALALSGDYAAAESSYERALDLKPDYTLVLANIASIAGRAGHYEKARLYATKVLATEPDEPIAQYALALAEIGERHYAEAEQILRRIVTNPNLNSDTRGGMYSLLGDALDAQKRYSEAFETYTRGNEYSRRDNAKQFEEARSSSTVGHMMAYFQTTSAERWKPADAGEAAADGPSQHVFLLGFMRSGTTLLEQVLASSQRVVALEERGTLTPLAEMYLRSNEGLDALAALEGEALDRARAGYWDRVRKFAPNLTGSIFVDKQPLNTVRLPLIAKIFPKAKVLFAIRDPRDVVFSCYRRPFQVNTTMFEFLELKDSATFYASIMALAKLYREKLTLDLMDHYYEDMVTDFEPRVRAVCDFIGLEWSDSMRDFNKHAPQININSPSAKQVRRPLYGEGIGQWRKYSEQLQPMLPILRPWVEGFGYSVE